MAFWGLEVEWHERDVVVPAFRQWLEAQGWETETETEFVDAVAHRGNEYRPLRSSSRRRSTPPRASRISSTSAAITKKQAGDAGAVLFSRVADAANKRDVRRALGLPNLTRRELEIVGLIEQGLSNKEIAVRLRIELPTVKNHVHKILDKLQLDGRREAARFARERGIIASAR